MQIGLMTEHLRDFSLPLRGNRHKNEYCCTDIGLNPFVEKILHRAMEQLGATDEIPIAWIGQQGHDDLGLVFEIASSTFLAGKEYSGSSCEFDFVHQELTARISFGPGKTGYHQAGEKRWDIGKLGRLHLMLLAGREYFPKDYQELFGLGNDAPTKKLTEKVIFAMRWLDSELDDWSNPSTWEQRDFHLGTCFHDTRSTYFECRVNDIGEETFQRIWPHVNVRRINIIPVSLSYAKVESTLPDEERKRFHKFYPDSRSSHLPCPTVGYEPTLDLLSRFGHVSLEDAARIHSMDMEQGAEFLLENVLEAMREFTRQY